MVQAKLLAPSFFSKSRPPVASRLSISYIKHNKHTLMFAQRWTQILPLFLTLCLKHTHIFAVTKSHRVCGQILCEERALTDVEAAARSRRNGERGSVGKKGRGCRICWPRSTAKIILPTDKRGCERRETFKKKKMRTSDTASAFTHVQVALLSYFKCQRSVAEDGGAFICVIHDQSSLRLSR